MDLERCLAELGPDATSVAVRSLYGRAIAWRTFRYHRNRMYTQPMRKGRPTLPLHWVRVIEDLIVADPFALPAVLVQRFKERVGRDIKISSVKRIRTRIRRQRRSLAPAATDPGAQN